MRTATSTTTGRTATGTASGRSIGAYAGVGFTVRLLAEDGTPLLAEDDTELLDQRSTTITPRGGE